MLTLDKIYHAAYVLRDVVRKTDLILAPHLNPDCELYLKTENLQTTGSFKVRGAYYKISQLSDEEKSKGVIACSAGNHAQGVALAAAKHGMKALICIPDGAPISKVEATKRYGADVCLVKGVYDDAYQKACELQQESGSTFIHPFNDEDVIAGQGSIGLELLDQLPELDAVIVPIGGGGLIGGVAFAIKSLRPSKLFSKSDVRSCATVQTFITSISGAIEVEPSTIIVPFGLNETNVLAFPTATYCFSTISCPINDLCICNLQDDHLPSLWIVRMNR